MKFDLKSKDYRVNLFLVDFFVFFSMIAMFIFGATANGVQKDVAYEYLAETAIAQEKYHRIQGVYNNEPQLTLTEMLSLQRKSYNSVFYRRVNSYVGVGSGNNLVRFSMNFEGMGGEGYDVSAISVSTYTNVNKMMEMIQLELYKTIDKDFLPQAGFDNVCYLPSTLADAIIEQSTIDDISTYDDIIDKKMAFSITAESAGTDFSERWMVSNIFYSDVGHYDGPSVEGYLAKDKGYGACLYSMLGQFIVTPSTEVHSFGGSTLFFDFYNSLFLPKEYIEFTFGKSFASDGSTIDFYTYSNESWTKIEALGFFSSLYTSNYSYIYNGNLLFFITGFLFLAFSLYPMSKIADDENQSNIEHKYPKVILVLSIPFVFIHLVYNLALRFLPLSVTKLLIYNVFGTVASLVITLHVLFMLFLPLILKKRITGKSV